MEQENVRPHEPRYHEWSPFDEPHIHAIVCALQGAFDDVKTQYPSLTSTDRYCGVREWIAVVFATMAMEDSDTVPILSKKKEKEIERFHLNREQSVNLKQRSNQAHAANALVKRLKHLEMDVQRALRMLRDDDYWTRKPRTDRRI